MCESDLRQFIVHFFPIIDICLRHKAIYHLWAMEIRSNVYGLCWWIQHCRYLISIDMRQILRYFSFTIGTFCVCRKNPNKKRHRGCLFWSDIKSHSISDTRLDSISSNKILSFSFDAYLYHSIPLLCFKSKLNTFWVLFFFHFAPTAKPRRVRYIKSQI